MNWMDKLSQTDECVTIGRCKISQLVFADDVVLLASLESGLQHALSGFAAACNIALMKISMSKTKVLFGSASLKQVEKFKYLGVAFMSDEKQDKELDV